MTDRYTKFVLTVIAVALVSIALRGFVPVASAQRGEICGSYLNPCLIQSAGPLEVFTSTPIEVYSR